MQPVTVIHPWSLFYQFNFMHWILSDSCTCVARSQSFVYWHCGGCLQPSTTFLQGTSCNAEVGAPAAYCGKDHTLEEEETLTPVVALVALSMLSSSSFCDLKLCGHLMVRLWKFGAQKSIHSCIDSSRKSWSLVEMIAQRSTPHIEQFESICASMFLDCLRSPFLWILCQYTKSSKTSMCFQGLMRTPVICKGKHFDRVLVDTHTSTITLYMVTWTQRVEWKCNKLHSGITNWSTISTVCPCEIWGDPLSCDWRKWNS